MKKSLINDAVTGKKVDLVTDTDGSQRIQSTQNFDTLMKLNSQMNNDWRPGSLRGTQKHMQHVAEIPNVVYAHLVEKFGKPSENPKAWKQWLNDSENRAFRTGGGHV